MRAVLGAATSLGERRRPAWDVAPQPFADGVAGAGEFASGGLEAVLAGEGDELLMQPMTIGAHTVKFRVGAVHAGRMASFARRCCASSGGGAAAPPCGDCSTPSTSPQGGHDLPSRSHHVMDYLLTWNCKHIHNVTTLRRIERLCERLGYNCPIICTPQDLMGA